VRANAPADETPGDDAQPLGVEIAQIDNIHGGKFSMD
jgi:hypothetical protein